MSITVDVKLSNDQIVQVKRLGLFELDDQLPKDILGDYTVPMLFEATGLSNEPFDMTVERPKPDKHFSECEEGSQDWYKWMEYQRYQAGFVHYDQQREQTIDHLRQCEAYIIEHCLSGEDAAKIMTADDMDAVKAAAISELSVSDLVQYAEAIFQAKYDEVSLFEAYEDVEKANGSYTWIAQLEYKLMRDLADTEEKYVTRSKKERVNMILAELIPDMIASLDTRDQIAKAEAQQNDHGTV